MNIAKINLKHVDKKLKNRAPIAATDQLSSYKIIQISYMSQTVAKKVLNMHSTKMIYKSFAPILQISRNMRYDITKLYRYLKYDIISLKEQFAMNLVKK